MTSGVAGNFLRVGPAADPYLLLDESQVQNWAARSPKDGSPDFAKQLGAAPVSAADRAAWQRDGSPTSWDYVGQSDGLADAQGDTSGLLLSLSMAGGPMTSLIAGYGTQQFPIGAKALTWPSCRRCRRSGHAEEADPGRRGGAGGEPERVPARRGAARPSWRCR